MEFEIKNAHGDVLRLFAEPDSTILGFEVIPAPLITEEEPEVVDGPPVDA